MWLSSAKLIVTCKYVNSGRPKEQPINKPYTNEDMVDAKIFTGGAPASQPPQCLPTIIHLCRQWA